MAFVLELQNVSVQYHQVYALQNINLSVAEHDFLAIIGPNGGGKSTLLKTILGLVRPQTGEIRIFGQDIEKNSQPVGYVPQFSSFNKDFPIKVLDVILSGKLSRKNSFLHQYTPEDYQQIERLMASLDILSLRDMQIGALSGGQLQRVLIARALAVNPGLILLDEPTASVDNDSKALIYDYLKNINKTVTIILVTHDTAVLSAYVKSIACLNRELHYHGEPALDHELIRKTFGCPVDLIAHGVPHRVLEDHRP